MSYSDVVVIDYGMGNLLSVQRGVEYCGLRATVTSDHGIILGAKHVILPGVGAFSNGMAELRKRNLDEVVLELADRGTPILGICLGMQMLLESSEEFGITSGLGLIRGRVVPIPPCASDGQVQKIPHIGWSTLLPREGVKDWLDGIRPTDSVYFVHSFMASPISADHRIADCIYGGIAVSAMIGRDNIVGCQFHPEKSGRVGLRFLEHFLSL